MARDGLSERYQGLAANFSLVPNLFHCQREFPSVIAAEQALVDAILVSEGGLSQNQRQALLHSVASVWPSQYCLNLFGCPSPPSSDLDSALSRFGMKLARYGAWCSRLDAEDLAAANFGEPSIIQAVATIALGHFFCTLAEGLRPDLDKGLDPISSISLPPSDLPEWIGTQGPYIREPSGDSESLQPPFRALVELLGFVPNLLRIQGTHPPIVQSQVGLLEAVLAPEEHLSQIQKHQILLALSTCNGNTYLVAVHSQILSLLGVTAADSDQIIENIDQAAIPLSERVLLRELSKLRVGPERDRRQVDIELLRSHGFSEAEIVEGLTVAALANMLATVQFGLGPLPDFPPRRVFNPKDLYLSEAECRPSPIESPIDDPDSGHVSRVKSGDTDAFEDLVRRHSRRVFGTLSGLLGNIDDARDATQDVFLKAFQHIDRFQGRSKFSTWLTSIAINTGTELLRQRRPTESLDGADDEQDFRPRQIQSWVDNPEQLLAKTQVNDLVRRGVLRLPEIYRVAVLMRDINQLPTEEAAAALGLSIPALKARVLRGRLMLRESLAPHFSRSGGDRDV